MSTSSHDAGTRNLALMHEIERFIRDRKPSAAVHAAREAVQDGAISIPQLHALILSPLMELTGARWQAGEQDVWEEHYTTAVVRTIVENMYDLVAVRAAEVPHMGRTAILACPEEEYHDLGLRMLADRFTLAGYTTHYLGAALPVDQLLSAVRNLDADTVVLSASTHFHRVGLRAYVDAVQELLPQVTVWVGGPAFARGCAGWTADEVPDIDALLGDLANGE